METNEGNCSFANMYMQLINGKYETLLKGETYGDFLF